MNRDVRRQGPLHIRLSLMADSPRNAVSVVCTDYRRSLDFYLNALGAEITNFDTGTCPWVRIGDLNITLLGNTDTPSNLGHSETAMAMLFLQVDDLSDSFDRAVKHGATVVDALAPDGVHFTIADPDGIIIEVMQYSND